MRKVYFECLGYCIKDFKLQVFSVRMLRHSYFICVSRSFFGNYQISRENDRFLQYVTLKIFFIKKKMRLQSPAEKESLTVPHSDE